MVRRKRAGHLFYLETSVWNFVFHDDSPERQQVTKDFFELVREGRFEVCASGLVLAEIEAAGAVRRDALSGLIAEIGPGILDVTPEAFEFAENLIQHSMVTAKHRNDAIHIAIATLAGVDLLVSWNFKHIVKPRTRRIVSGLTRMLGYKELQICSPEEVAFDER